MIIILLSKYFTRCEFVLEKRTHVRYNILTVKEVKDMKNEREKTYRKIMSLWDEKVNNAQTLDEIIEEQDLAFTQLKAETPEYQDMYKIYSIFYATLITEKINQHRN